MKNGNAGIEKDGSMQIIVICHDNLSDKASSLHMVDKETFEHTMAKCYFVG